ncbi:hypothetical protein BGZ58_009356 [Dissophora ornata]|nr:hypothetical protein BGZ58_009356 [Dissophora ornata]
MHHPSPLRQALRLALCLVLVLVLAPQSTYANTEKVIFTANHASTPAAELGIRGSDAAAQRMVNPSQWKRLSSPHTIIRAETLLPSFYENDIAISSQLKRLAPSPTSLLSGLVKDIAGGVDLKDRDFKWYVLEGLEDGASFELRISYPATSPADFEMTVWTLDQVQGLVPNSTHLFEQFTQETMFARIKATYTGVSYRSDGISGPETLPVPYNLVLERLYLLIPYQALKLAAVIIIAVIVGLGFVAPNIRLALLDVASAGTGRDSGKKAL